MPLRPIVAPSVEIDLDVNPRLEPLVIPGHDNEAVGSCHRSEDPGAAGPEGFDLPVPDELNPDEVRAVQGRGELPPEASPHPPVPPLSRLTELALKSGADEDVEAH